MLGLGVGQVNEGLEIDGVSRVNWRDSASLKGAGLQRVWLVRLRTL